jgi:hypothetical protein
MMVDYRAYCLASPAKVQETSIHANLDSVSNGHVQVL